MRKSPDAFRTISEVAQDLDLPQHVLRFWETRFSQIKPMKRGGGRRYYRPDDVDLLRGIRHLLYDEGYTIKGVQRILKEQGVRHVIDSVTEGESEYEDAAGVEAASGQASGAPMRQPAHEAQPYPASEMQGQPQIQGQPQALEQSAPPPHTRPQQQPKQAQQPELGTASGTMASSRNAPRVASHQQGQEAPQQSGPQHPPYGSVHPSPVAYDQEIPEGSGVAAPATRPPFADRAVGPQQMAPAKPQATYPLVDAGHGPEGMQTAPVAHVPVNATGPVPTPSPAAMGQPRDTGAPTTPHASLEKADMADAVHTVPLGNEAARGRYLEDEHKNGFFSRLRAGRSEVPLAELPEADVRGLGRDDVRRLQSTLFELLECKRLLDHARNDGPKPDEKQHDK